jgi:hypothetical protein
MGQVIELRIARLEEAARPKSDIDSLTEEELHAALTECWLATISDPHSTQEQVARARRMMALPWGRKDWSIEELAFFCSEAHRDD